MTTRQRASYISGFCSSVALPPGVEPHHHRCRGAFINPKDKSTYRCTCDCHSGDEVPVPRESIAVAKVEKVAPGKRSSSVLEDIYEALKRDGEFRLPAPDDPKELKSRRERIYTAARRKGMKVKVVVRDGEIIATVK